MLGQIIFNGLPKITVGGHCDRNGYVIICIIGFFPFLKGNNGWIYRQSIENAKRTDSVVINHSP